MKHFLLQIQKRRMSVRELAFVGMISLTIFLGASATLVAAPVTFAFEAEITTVSRGIPFDSGVDIAVGDTISGQFTFDPLEDCAEFDGPGQPLGGLCETTQPFSFSVEIDGATFRTSDYELKVRDNAPIQDFPSATVIDVIDSGGKLSPLDPLGFSNIDSTASSFKMSLRGRSDSFAAANVSASVEIWNQPSLTRTIGISLRDGVGHVVGFQAAVGRFFVIPEPSSFCLLSLISLWVLPQRYFLSSRRG